MTNKNATALCNRPFAGSPDAASCASCIPDTFAALLGRSVLPKRSARPGDTVRFRARQARTDAAVRELPGLRNFGR